MFCSCVSQGILSGFWFTESRQSFWPWVQSREICELIQEHLERTLPLELQTLWRKRKSRMRKAIGNCFQKIHHCMIAKMKLRNYGHLAFWAPLLKGLRCSQRPRHSQDFTLPIWKWDMKMACQWWWLLRARAGRGICSIHRRWQFHPFARLLLLRGKAGPLCRDVPEDWQDVLALLCSFKHTYAHS